MRFIYIVMNIVFVENSRAADRSDHNLRDINSLGKAFKRSKLVTSFGK